MMTHKARYILGLVCCLTAVAGYAQDAKLDEDARIALARGENRQVLNIVTQLEGAGSPLSALNAYRAALAAERLQDAVTAERYLAYAINQDPALKFATAADKVLALKQKIADKLRRPFDERAGLSTTKLEPIAVSEKTTPPIEASPQLETLEKEKKALAAKYETLQDQLLQIAARNAAAADSGITSKRLVGLIVAVGIVNALLLLLAVSGITIMLRNERKRAAELAALQQISPGPKAFRELAQELHDRLLVAEELLRKDHSNTAFYNSVSIALPAICEYLEQTKPDGATFVSHPSLLPTQSLAEVTTQAFSRSAPKRVKTA